MTDREEPKPFATKAEAQAAAEAFARDVTQLRVKHGVAEYVVAALTRSVDGEDQKVHGVIGGHGTPYGRAYLGGMMHAQCTAPYVARQQAWIDSIDSGAVDYEPGSEA